MKPTSLSAVVLATAALLVTPATATTPTYTCHSFTHHSYTGHSLTTKGIDCGTAIGFAKRIIDHGTGFLVHAKYMCREAVNHSGHGYVHCEKPPYISLAFHFHPTGL